MFNNVHVTLRTLTCYLIDTNERVIFCQIGLYALLDKRIGLHLVDICPNL